VKIALCRSHGLVACAIRWQTRSQYSHAAILTARGVWCEATWPRVRALPQPPAGTDADLFEVPMTPDQERALNRFILEQLGKPYDLTMVLRFVTREQESRRSSRRWFCSELVFAAFRRAGIALLERCEPWEVSPALLSLSPLLLPAGRLGETTSRHPSP
jgi:uncharacterized protein YycO